MGDPETYCGGVHDGTPFFDCPSCAEWLANQVLSLEREVKVWENKARAFADTAHRQRERADALEKAVYTDCACGGCLAKGA